MAASRAVPSYHRQIVFLPVIALLLAVLGIAWIVYYYAVVRVDPLAFPAPAAGDLADQEAGDLDGSP